MINKISDQEAIELINKKLLKAAKLNKVAVSGIPIYKSLAFLLDKFNQGDYYGTIQIKIIGTSVMDPKEIEVTHRLDKSYNEV